HFETRVTGLVQRGGAVRGVVTAAGDAIEGVAVVLGAGHSARDVFHLLRRRGLRLEQKAFALGGRVAHPQALVDRLESRCAGRPPGLRAAAYALAQRAGERGIWSFCMCPGGIVCPATTAADEVVVNGWSPSARSSRFANAGIVVETAPEDFRAFGG